MGLSSGWRVRGLAILLWLSNLLTAAVFAVPVSAYLRRSLSFAPEADRLLSSFSPEVMNDLGESAGEVGTALRASLALALCLTLLQNAFTSGGVLEALRPGDSRPLWHRFGRGAFVHCGRMLKLGVVGALWALVGAVAALLLIAPLRSSLDETRFEPGPWILFGCGASAAFAVVVLALLALDLARADAVRGAHEGVIRLYFRSVRLVLRHPLRLLAIWIVNALLLALGALAYFGGTARLPGATWSGLLALALAQQGFMVWRAFLRVTLYAGVVEQLEALRPLAPHSETEAAARIEQPEDGSPAE